MVKRNDCLEIDYLELGVDLEESLFTEDDRRFLIYMKFLTHVWEKSRKWTKMNGEENARRCVNRLQTRDKGKGTNKGWRYSYDDKKKQTWQGWQQTVITTEWLRYYMCRVTGKLKGWKEERESGGDVRAIQGETGRGGWRKKKKIRSVKKHNVGENMTTKPGRDMK